jgi:prepilin-type N-terminal cleavage/methylation domain-containing protein
MLTKQSKDQKGFTIIEVLIVLAIAGLILLIVFLAVPALQRNSRNTQRKNDVAAVLAAVSEFSNNNAGALPNGVWTNTNGTVTEIGAAGTASSEAKVGFYNVGIGATAGSINKVAANTLTAAGTLNSAAEDFVTVSTGTVCSGVASVAGPARSVTAVFEVENGNGTYAQQCQSS